MSVRRQLGFTLACCALLLGMSSVPALARGTYDHDWQIEGLYAGNAGETRKVVQSSSATLELGDEGWRGVITLRDVLGIRGAAGITDSQQTSMTLNLEGDPQAGGTTAAGYFSGVAQVRLRGVSSLSEATKPSAAGSLVTYDVYGYWAARVSGTDARGNLLFQAIRPRGAAMPERTAAWFNRASLESIDGTAEPQAFTASTRGAVIAPGDDEAGPDPADKGGAARPSVFERVWRGLTHRGSRRAVPVPGSASTLARALADAAPSDATALPANSLAIDRDVPALMLDAKNRAAGLLEGVPGDPVLGSAGAAGTAVPHATGDGADARLRPELLANLSAANAISGASVLATDVSSLPARIDTQTAARLAAWSGVVKALTGAQDPADVLVPAGAVSAKVAKASIATKGPLADAVLAAADHAGAPVDALRVRSFEREQASDIRAGAALPNAAAPVSDWVSVSATDVALARTSGEVVASKSWSAYRRGDGALYWMPTPDLGIALTAGGVSGWVWRTQEALVVDSVRAGKALEVIAEKARQ